MTKAKLSRSLYWLKAGIITLFGLLPGCGDDKPEAKDAVTTLKNSGLIQKSYAVSKEEGQVCSSCSRK